MTSSVTLRSARAPTRCTVAISRSTRASVISRSRSTTSAASKVIVASGALRARRRRCEGDSIQPSTEAVAAALAEHDPGSRRR